MNGKNPDPLFFRRTVIPILLTTGVILGSAGIFIRTGGQDTTLADVMPSWAAMALIALGAASLGLGILTMLSVRHALSRPPGPR